MKIAAIILSIVVSIALSAAVFAVTPGKSIEYPGGDAGKVIFNGDTHGAKQGMKCNDCHPKPFGMKKGSFKMTKESHNTGEYCGICHNGTRAFAQNSEADCGKCHLKTAAEPAKAPEAAPEEKKQEEKKEEPAPAPAGESK